ncbi:MAG TPA: 3D domain-containing protein [Bryobacteraceae bacterium]|nr:3D domain-containing protein [Bryobacteraceae bacterium]
MLNTALCCVLSLALAAPAVPAALAKRATVLHMSATAYSIHGKQASGTMAREGTAAADPKVLPLGSRVHVHTSRGRFIGEFVITDTGRRMKGHEIDIFLKSNASARRFGRKRVRVRVRKWGNGPAHARNEVKAGLQTPQPH